MFQGETRIFVTRSGVTTASNLPDQPRGSNDNWGYYCGVELQGRFIIWDRRDPWVVFQFNPIENSWTAVEKPYWGRDELTVRNRRGDLTHVFYQDDEGQFQMLDLKTNFRTRWPSFENHSFKEAIEYLPGKFVFYGGNEIYIGDGTTWNLIDTNEDAKGHMLVDDAGNLWIGGELRKLIKYDLPLIVN